MYPNYIARNLNWRIVGLNLYLKTKRKYPQKDTFFLYSATFPVKNTGVK